MVRAPGLGALCDAIQVRAGGGVGTERRTVLGVVMSILDASIRVLGSRVWRKQLRLVADVVPVVFPNEYVRSEYYQTSNGTTGPRVSQRSKPSSIKRKGPLNREGVHMYGCTSRWILALAQRPRTIECWRTKEELPRPWQWGKHIIRIPALS